MNNPETLDEIGKLELRIQELEHTLKSLLYTIELRDNSNPFKLKKTPLYDLVMRNKDRFNSVNNVKIGE